MAETTLFSCAPLDDRIAVSGIARSRAAKDHPERAVSEVAPQILYDTRTFALEKSLGTANPVANLSVLKHLPHCC